MVKLLEQLNQEFFDTYSTQKPRKAPRFSVCSKRSVKSKAVTEKPKKKRIVKLVLDILFYTVIGSILIATLVFGGKSTSWPNLFGYSGFHVVSSSMQPEIPQDSLVITKKVVDADSIQLGDDITFIRNDNDIVTHRVINIIENYDDSGIRGFKTWGIDNLEPDPTVVRAGDVIGVVELSIPKLGAVLASISENIGVVFLFLGVIAAMAIVAKKLFAGVKKEKPARFTRAA